MPKGKMSEEGFETFIVNYLTSQNGYEEGKNSDYDMKYAMDIKRLFRFIKDTQKEAYESCSLDTESGQDRFVKRLSSDITRRGIIDVLKNGINFYPTGVILFYLTPDKRNPKACENYKKNIFSVTRQLHYSEKQKGLAIDLVLFVNGLPIITIELKNRITGQNYLDAVEQYKRDRNPKELLLSFKRCLVHFAMDDCGVMFSTKLEGKTSFFMPFNKGNGEGAGNPVNPNGMMTSYMWEEIFKKDELTNIIENYAQVIKKKDEKKKSELQIFPRYHQLRVVKRLLKDVKENGLGKKYLIQHSAGSGKSNSITWLAYQLVGLTNGEHSLFDSVIVVTDRRNLDSQLTENLKNFMEVSSTVANAENTKELKELLKEGKKIITSTVQKFPFLLDKIGKELKDKTFGIIIDEAHSSQSGKASASMNMSLSGSVDSSQLDVEEKILEIIEGRKMLENASYFAFTATPKSKTLEMFGTKNPKNSNEKIPFDNYSMKQAIEEGFILDVLKHYIPITTHYKITKTIEENPKFDANKARKKLKTFVEGQEYPLRRKAEIMVDHFHKCTAKKIRGQARAMVVTSSIERAIDYYYLISKVLDDIKSPYKAIVAFSGSKSYHGKDLTESTINGFPSTQIPAKFREEPYRFLIVADKFQTGFDEPLLHTMYVDKVLEGVKAVQTLSRLNRCMYGKNDTCVLDFANSPDKIKESFSKFYTVTELEGEVDPNILYDILGILEKEQVFNESIVDEVVTKFLGDEDRDKIDALLDECVKRYMELDEEEQVEFKGGGKSFIRAYNFIASILPIGQIWWEKMSIFLTLLVPKLPSPKEEDLSKGILDSVDLDSYRVEKKDEVSISMIEEIEALKPSSYGVGVKKEPEIKGLNDIVEEFNELFGDIDWKDEDNIIRQLKELPQKMAKIKAVENAYKNSGSQNSRLESDKFIGDFMVGSIADGVELYKLYNDNQMFRKWVSDMVYRELSNMYSHS